MTWIYSQQVGGVGVVKIFLSAHPDGAAVDRGPVVSGDAEMENENWIQYLWRWQLAN